MIDKKEDALEAVRRDGFALQYISCELQNDKDVVLEVAKNNKYALKYASPELQKYYSENDFSEDYLL